MNELYNNHSEIFGKSVVKKIKDLLKSKPHDFGKGILIKEWQLEIPFKEGSIKECFEKRFTFEKIESVSDSTVIFQNGLIISYEIVDRNISFRKCQSI